MVDDFKKKQNTNNTHLLPSFLMVDRCKKAIKSRDPPGTLYLKESARSYLLYLLTTFILAKRVEYTEDTFASASLEICMPGGSYFGYSVFPGVMLACLMHSPESLFQTCNSFY
jgi:hypothetical protein